MLLLYYFIGFIVAFADLAINFERYKKLQKENYYYPHLEFLVVWLFWLPLFIFIIFDKFITWAIGGKK